MLPFLFWEKPMLFGGDWLEKIPEISALVLTTISNCFGHNSLRIRRVTGLVWFIQAGCGLLHKFRKLLYRHELTQIAAAQTCA
jgi:hypothetical protein